jgi:hypothetical protein
VEKEQKSTPVTHIFLIAQFWLGTDASIKSAWVILVFREKYPLLVKEYVMYNTCVIQVEQLNNPKEHNFDGSN